MRLKSLSDNDFLYVSLACRHASVVAVSSALNTGEAKLLLEVCCSYNWDGARLLEPGLSSSDECGCDISGKALFPVEARVDSADRWHGRPSLTYQDSHATGLSSIHLTVWQCVFASQVGK